MYIAKGKIYNFLNGACGNFYGGRNMTVELDSGIRSFQKLDGENEDLTLILRKKMEMFADTSAFNAGVKEKNTKTNKITIIKNQKLATLHPAFGRSGCRCLTLRSYFYPASLTFGDGQIR
jgi:hypothetical protein